MSLTIHTYVLTQLANAIFNQFVLKYYIIEVEFNFDGLAGIELLKCNKSVALNLLGFEFIVFVGFWVSNVGKPWQNMTKTKSH